MIGKHNSEVTLVKQFVNIGDNEEGSKQRSLWKTFRDSASNHCTIDLVPRKTIVKPFGDLFREAQ